MIVAEGGERLATLAEPGLQDATRDVNPAFSPDGASVAFASSRERGFDESSLWVVAARPRSVPVRITTGAGIDLWPVWAPDGGSLVYASTRDGDLDLWRIAVRFDGEVPRAVGAPEQVTDLPGEELAPAIAADGRIAFTHIAHGDGVPLRGRIAVRALDGAITYLTEGPADTSPAWSPDGRRVVFSAPHLRDAEPPRVDADLWAVAADGSSEAPELMLDADITDESGPAWSRDGRWLFASSLFRGADGTARFSSIVYRDTTGPAATVHMLVDPAGAVPRLGVAVAPRPLDDAALGRGPPYADELAAILRGAVEAAEARDP